MRQREYRRPPYKMAAASGPCMRRRPSVSRPAAAPPCPRTSASYPGNDRFDYWNLSDGQLHHELVMHEVFLTEAVAACSREYPGERSYYGPVAYTPDFSDFE